MTVINHSTFPEYIVIIMGASFPASSSVKGIYDLKENDLVVLKKVPGIPVNMVTYTEDGTLVCSDPTAYPYSSGLIPPNRLKMTMSDFPAVAPYMMNTGFGFVNFSYAEPAAVVNGWSAAAGTWSPTYIYGDVFDVSYVFRDVFDYITTGNFKKNSIKDVYEYFPDFEVNSETGGTAEASNLVPLIGDSVTVTATANDNYIFSGWSLNGSIVSIDNPYTLIVPYVDVYDSYRLCAVFEPTLNNNIVPSSECVLKNKILSQKIELNSTKTISKVSLFLDIENSEKTEYIEELNGIVSFSAANFQETTNEHAWKLSTDINDLTTYNSAVDTVSSSGFLINAITSDYSTAEEIYSFAPKLKYNIFISPGTYAFWAKSKGGGQFWYSWNSDVIPNEVTTTTDTSWQQIGTINVSETSIFTLNVFLGNGNISLDQFYLTNIENGEDLSLAEYSLPLSKSPFNTFVRIRENYSDIDYYSWAWKSSNKIDSSDWYNYDINSYSGAGLMMDFIVISSSPNFHARWNYNTLGTEESTYISIDYGKTFIKE